jgi:hypothetical protein
MTDPLAICRTCFWSAHFTRTANEIWCSHATHFGWHSVPSCEGKAYKVDERPASADAPDRSID